MPGRLTRRLQRRLIVLLARTWRTYAALNSEAPATNADNVVTAILLTIFLALWLAAGPQLAK